MPTPRGSACRPFETLAACRSVRAVALVLTSASLLGPLVGCYTPPPPRDFGPPPPPKARVIDQVGGTHHVQTVHDGRWYCGFGSELLVLEPTRGFLRHRMALREFGEGGAICDLIVRGDSMYAVLEDTAVVELSLADPDRPEIVGEIASEDLGVMPRSIREVEGALYVSGRGGVVLFDDPGRPRLADRLAESDATEAGPVVPTEHGPAASTGRRVHRIDGGRYLGAATALEVVPNSRNGPAPSRLAFALQGANAAEVGLAGPDLRSIATRAVPGEVRRIRVDGDRLWVVEDTAILGYPIQGDRLGDPLFVSVSGARDVAVLDENHLAVCGRFGRAIYRIATTDQGPGDTFFAVVREPSGLEKATHDGRSVLTGGPEGAWLYDAGRGARLTEPPDSESLEPETEAVAAWGTANIVDSGRRVEVEFEPLVGPKGEEVALPTFSWSPPRDGLAITLLIVGDSLWVGHERGLDLLRRELPPEDLEPDDPEWPPPMRHVEGLEFDGPVRYLFPQRIGSRVHFVSVEGGLGVVDDE
ncbi:MAG: hypothetical protein ACO3QA_00900 [Phycisphaerales bacterium]